LPIRKPWEDADIPFREELVVHIDVDSIDENIRAMDRVMNMPDSPTAALCLDDDLAAGLLYILNDLGYSVPENMSIIAHGDMLDYSRFQTPRITTMRMDPITSSKIAVELLIEKLKEPRMVTQTVKVQEHIRDRGSCVSKST
jgi:DNA-binding LacI/PurR family transcriptional regulator